VRSPWLLVATCMVSWSCGHGTDCGGPCPAGFTCSAEGVCQPAPAPPQTAPLEVRAVGGVRQTAISWSAVPGADRYRVLRSFTSGGPYAELTATRSQNYLDAVDQDSVTSFYRIRGANAGGDGPLSDEVSATTSPTWAAVPVPRINGIDLSWPAYPGAAKYGAQCSGGNPEQTAVQVPITTTSVSFSNLPGAVVFRCDVVAYGIKFDPIATAPTLHVTPLRPPPSFAFNFSVRASQLRAEMEWLPANNADFYVISRGDTQFATTFTDIAQVTDTKYVDFDVAPWTRYSYRIRAVNESGPGPVPTPFPVAIFGNPLLSNPGPVDASPVSVTTTRTGGQTVLAPATGQLMGFEVSITEAGALAGVDLMTLSVFSGSVLLGQTGHSPLATYKVFAPPFRGLPQDLPATDIGTGYYDFSDAGIFVSEGEPLRFVLSDEAVPSDDAETALLGHTADQYGGGNAMQGLGDLPGDLAFKLFVNEGAVPP
jgi:hypothetical protein